MNIIEEYEKYIAKIGDRKTLYRLVANRFDVKMALYPGSHIDIGASLVIPNVTYIDNYKGTIQFFKHLIEVRNYINMNKEYPEECTIEFFGLDYNENIKLDKVDMIISQFAGFVGQATKKHLKKGGILLCNDSHGDATLAYLDDDYEFIGVVESNNTIITDELEKYFKFANERQIDRNKVLTKMKGPRYKTQPSNYIFLLKKNI
ncbi:hypothetical protein BK010_10775 (plasmid) [Tenericutes bacterium MO-XQ]|nr:hypothetical protein BK010_10775 [Tenericutes bacterium MO-XQ]